MNEQSKASNSQWKPIKSLRKVGQNYSGWSYTYDWAKANGLFERATGQSFWKLHTVYVPEPLEIKMSNDGIYYRLAEFPNGECPSSFNTVFGVFHNDNQGEFGGTLVSPSGLSVEGNFTLVFDFDDKVYAIDSLHHMGLRHFKLHEFKDASHYRCLYDVGGWGSRYNESLDFQGLFIASEGMYILIGGDILSDETNTDNDMHNYKETSKLLFVSNGKINECLEVGETFEEVKNIIVLNHYLYVASDKILTVIDMGSGESQYYTFIGKKAVRNLLAAHDK